MEENRHLTDMSGVDFPAFSGSFLIRKKSKHGLLAYETLEFRFQLLYLERHVAALSCCLLIERRYLGLVMEHDVAHTSLEPCTYSLVYLLTIGVDNSTSEIIHHQFIVACETLKFVAPLAYAIVHRIIAHVADGCIHMTISNLLQCVIQDILLHHFLSYNIIVGY